MKKLILKSLAVAIMGFMTTASYAALPSSGIEYNMATQQASNSRVTLSLTLYQKLMYKKPAQIVQYLKQQGCTLKKVDSYYITSVKGGYIYVFMKKPLKGVAPICFSTSDNNVYEAWARSFRKQGYDTDNMGSWYGVSGHWPSFRVDINGRTQTILFLESYPLKYNPKTNSYE